MSKVIDILVTPATSAPQLKKKIKAAKAVEGDTLKFSFSDNALFSIFVIMVLLIVRSVLAAERKKERQKEGADVLGSILDGKKSQDQLEQEIADEFGINVEFEVGKSKDNPLDRAFGIWKDNDISLDQIREIAWQKRA
jgi:alkyl hydroperoxide reductase subunit AhpC